MNYAVKPMKRVAQYIFAVSRINLVHTSHDNFNGCYIFTRMVLRLTKHNGS